MRSGDYCLRNMRYYPNRKSTGQGHKVSVVNFQDIT